MKTPLQDAVTAAGWTWQRRIRHVLIVPFSHSRTSSLTVGADGRHVSNALTGGMRTDAGAKLNPAFRASTRTLWPLAKSSLFKSSLLVSSLFTMATASAQEATTIKVGFVLASNVTAPVPTQGHHTAYSATLILSGANRVTERWESENVRGTNSSYHSNDSGLGSRWRVVAPNTIKASWRMPNYTKSVTVRVSGKTCTVNFETQLLPGETDYKTRYGQVTFVHSKPVMIDPTCSIQ